MKKPQDSSIKELGILERDEFVLVGRIRYSESYYRLIGDKQKQYHKSIEAILDECNIDVVLLLDSTGFTSQVIGIYKTRKLENLQLFFSKLNKLKYNRYATAELEICIWRESQDFIKEYGLGEGNG